MKTLRKKGRIQLLAVSAILLIIASVLIGYGFREGISYFRNPTQVLADMPGPEETFRVGGLVQPNSIRKNTDGSIEFEIGDLESSIRVVYTGIPPDLFTEGQGAIALGNYVNGVFEATEILAKHDEKYMPKEIADTLREQGLFKPSGEISD
ncbi:MAG: cytochrome c maturation protein CcmE [Paracoccaceae bacterium]|nr:cytochrome c maturation protein CcmE [Paracoccaceae bacterium]MDE2917667.1 cytochrome c maturation protein CcmE [Paracoccaceae bacterium]